MAEIVYLGYGFKNFKIVKKKPNVSAIIIFKGKHFIAYAYGAKNYVVPRKGIILKRERRKKIK